MWFYPDGIANVLSLKNVRQHYRVTYDSANNDNTFIVHKPDGHNCTFRMAPSGLYYLNIPDPDNQVALVQTVDKTSKCTPSRM